MALKDDKTLLTKGDLKKFYNKILPYMGGNYVFNTLGVKDYYSEDEKVIGIWTDGKPLYQKTFSGNLPSSDLSIDVSSLNIDTFVNSKGMIKDTGGNCITSNYWNGSAGGPWYHILYYSTSTSSLKMMFSPSATYNGKPYSITIQYTKTTDAANSAVGTIGCYDITRPDLWPENKEITFGNGLYGQRFVGTYTPVACSASTNTAPSGQVDTVLLTGVDYTQSIGGHVEGYNTGTSFPMPTSNNNNANGVFLYVTQAGNLVFRSVCWMEVKSSNITDKKYDVWVTYKKK